MYSSKMPVVAMVKFMQTKGAYHFSKKIRKFRLKVKWNSNSPENPGWTTSRDTSLFPFGMERRKFPYHLHGFPVPVCHNEKQ